MLGKIRLTKKIVVEDSNVEVPKISLKKKEISLDFHHIKNNFYDPIIRLMENNGCNDDGQCIADVHGLQVISEIIHSILYNAENESGSLLGPIEIIERAVLADLEKEVEINLSENVETCVSSIDDDEEERGYEEEEEDDDDEDENEGQIEDNLEEDDWENIEEYKEYDQYLENAVEDNMNDY